MAFMNKEVIDLKGILFLMLLTLPSIATTNLDCYGKAFHCVNSTHFMICVDLGRGISTTVDEFIIPCPATTVCRSTNRFECEFPAPEVLPIERSTTATISTSESEVATSNSLVTTTIPYEEYFNTISSTTLSESDLQSSTVDNILPVHSVSSSASTSETVITNESTLKDTNVQPGSTIDNISNISVKSSDVISSSVENNFTLNLNVIPHETTTASLIHELTTIHDPQVPTSTTDLPVLNTTNNYSQNVITTDITSAITEPTLSTTELLTNDLLEPLVNVTIPEKFSNAQDIVMTAEPIAEVKEVLNISKLETDVIADEPVGFNNTSTHAESLTNTSPGNQTQLKKSSTTTPSLKHIQTIIPYATVTDMNQSEFTNTDKLDIHVAGSFIFNTETPPDLPTTATITINRSENVTKPILVTDHYLTSATDYYVTVEPSKDVKDIVNVTKSETNIIVNSTVIVGSTEASKTTEAHAKFSSNSNNPNVKVIAEPTTEVNDSVHATKLKTNLMIDFTLNPTDANKTTESQVHIFSNNSFSSNVFNNSNAEVSTEYTRGTKELVNVTKSEPEIIMNTSAVWSTDANTITEAQVNIVNNVSINNVTNSDRINVNLITIKEGTTTTNVGYYQEIYTANTTMEQPVTESSILTTENNVSNITATYIDITTTAIASTTETISIVAYSSLANEDVTTNSNTIIENATTTPKNNLVTLKNSSSKLTKDLELTTENINNLQNDAENILNHLLRNLTDKLVLNEKVLLTNFEDNKASTQTDKSDLGTITETSTNSAYTLVQDNELTVNHPQPSMHEQTTIADDIAAYRNDSATHANKDLLNETSSRSENPVQSESATFFTSLPLSIFTIEASDRPIMENTPQLNENTNTDSINYVGFAYTDPLTVTTEMPSTTIRSGVPNSSILKEYADQVSPPDQNQLIGTSATENISLTPLTGTLNQNKMSSTKYIEISQTHVTIETFTELPSTNIKTTEALYTSSNSTTTNRTEAITDTTINYGDNFEITTRIDLPSQSTVPNDFLTTSDSLIVEPNRLNNSEVSTNVNDGSIGSNIIITKNQSPLGSISVAATSKEESTVSPDIIDKITESLGNLNHTTNNLSERNIVTTETVYTSARPDTYTVEPSDGNADTVKTVQKPLIVSVGEEMQKSQTDIPISITEINSDSVMTSSTDTTIILDLIETVKASTSQSEIPLSTDIVVEAITQSMIQDVPAEVDVDQGSNTEKNNTPIFSTKSVSDIVTGQSTTLGDVLLENSTITQDLRSTLASKIITTTENTSFRSSNPDAQTATDIPVTSRFDIIAFKDNQTTTLDSGSSSYLQSQINPLKDVTFNTSHESNSAAENVAFDVSNTHTNFNTQSLINASNNVGTASFTINITVHNPSNISLVDGKETNVLNQELSVKLHNETTELNINSDLKSQSLITENKGIAAAPTINDLPVTGLPNNIEINTKNSYDTQSQIPEDVNLETTKTINSDINDIRFAEQLNTSENEANHVPLNLNINNANYRVDGSNTQSVVSADKHLGMTTSNNNGITITEPLDKVSNIPNSEIFGVSSNLTKTNITNVKQNIGINTTSKNDPIEEPRGTIVVYTPSSISIETVTYPMQKTITQTDNTLTSNDSNIEMSQTMVSTSQTSDLLSSHQSGDESKYNIQVTTIQSLFENEKPTTQKSILKNLSFAPQENNIQNAAIGKPTIGIGVTKPIDFDRFHFANVMNTQSIKIVDSSIATDKFILDRTETTRSVIDITRESLSPPSIQNRQEYLKTSDRILGDVKSTGLASITTVTKSIENGLTKTTEKSPVSLANINTDNGVHAKRAVASTVGLRTEIWKGETNTEVNWNDPLNGNLNLIPETTNPSIEPKSSTQSILSAGSLTIGLGTEISTGSDVLVGNNMESVKTHSGIISLITQLPPYDRDLKKKKEKPVNEESEFEEGSETLLVNASITISQKNKISTREELLIKKDSNDYKSTTDRDGLNLSSIKNSFNKINDIGTKIAGSEIKTETPTHELLEIGTPVSTKDSYTSSSKSKDQNKSTSDTHSTTVISNDQRGTPRYVSQKSTAVDDLQTEFPPFESTTLKQKTNKVTCKNKKRGRYADEVDCRKFYICLGNSHVVEGTCPNNTVFSEIRKQCTTNLSHCIRNNQFRCVTEGHFSDFLDDNVYYICVKNKLKLNSFIRFKLMCTTGYHLNRTSVRCVLNEESKESTSTGDSSKNNSDQTGSSAITEEKKNPVKKFKCKKEGFFADRTNCTKYFECTKTDSTGVYRQKRKKCSGDKIFSTDKKRCIDGESDECN